MLDIILSILLALCAFQMGYLGVRSTLHPLQSDQERTAYKFAFGILAVVSIILILWQGMRSKDSQEESKYAQTQLHGTIEDEKKIAEAARSEVKEMRVQMDRLRIDLAGESARREQAQKDMALIIKKAGTETRTGIADDFRKSGMETMAKRKAIRQQLASYVEEGEELKRRCLMKEDPELLAKDGDQWGMRAATYLTAKLDSSYRIQFVNPPPPMPIGHNGVSQANDRIWGMLDAHIGVLRKFIAELKD